MSDSIDGLLEQRGRIYGDMVGTHARIAEVWSGILGRHVSAHQVALCMVGLKLVRADLSPDHLDSHDDMQGYARIARVIAESWREDGASDPTD